MQTMVWIYFSKTGVGYEIKGEEIISAFDAFIHMQGTYIIELSFSPILNDVNFFIYEWDNSQRKRKTVYEKLKKEIVLLGLMKNVEIPENVKLHICRMFDSEELKIEANANS